MVFEDLSAKFTGNTVQRFDDVVIKQGKTIGLEYQWYQSFEQKEAIPKVTYDNGALKMQYLESVGPVDLSKVIEIVERYKDQQPLSFDGFDEYLERISNHLKNNPVHNGDKLLFKLRQAHLWPTFAHGDLSIRNIIQTVSGPKLIDPLYGDRFGSYMLDYAKLLFTLKFFDGNVSDFNELMTITQVPPVFIASECVRVCTYNKRFNFIAENLINEI